MFENFRVALTSLLSNKLRALLTMLGITIGVAAVITLVSVGQAFESFVNNLFSGVGANLIIVLPDFEDQNDFVPLTMQDFDVINDPFRVPDVLAVAPQLNTTRTAKFENRELSVTVQGVQPELLETFNRSVALGRFLTARDLETTARVAVIEQGVADALFPGVFPVGQSLRVGDVRFDIIGVMSDENAGIFGSSNSVLIPITTAQTRIRGERLLSGERSISFIAAKARDTDSVADATRQITAALRESREVAFRADDNFIIFTQDQVLDSLGQITGLLTIFLALLAGISLLVGGIGIMNIMLVTVTERTREIGLRKAVGAQKGDILMQFLTEAVVLCLVGGGAGVAIAFTMSALATAFIPDLTVTLQESSVLLATLISVGIGVFFGSYPANQAASLNPIDALRYE